MRLPSSRHGAGRSRRHKSNEQKLREFALWKEVEKELAKGRMLNGPGQENHHGEKHQGGKKGAARDLAAKRVGIGSGSDAEKAHKALMVADQAEASGDAELVAKAQEVKQALDKGISAATRPAESAPSMHHGEGRRGGRRTRLES